MYCPRCGSKVDESWQYCAKCGTRLLRPVRAGKPVRISGTFSFDNIFKNLEKQMDLMGKNSEKDVRDIDRDIEFFNIKPFDSKEKPQIKKSGFSISIKTGTGMKPVVNIRTLGNVDRERLEKEISGKFGIGISPGKPVQEPQEPAEIKDVRKDRPIPKTTEEPKINIKKLPNLIVIETDLPGVESISDIDINKFKESIEIRALSREKLYFKIIQIPEEWRLDKKEFKNGTLRLELAP